MAAPADHTAVALAPNDALAALRSSRPVARIARPGAVRRLPQGWKADRERLMMLEHLASLIPRLAGHHVLVVGDVILDEYLVGRANRLSREAPIPVLEFERRDTIPGGAANPAANIAALGSHAIQVGVIGIDA